MDATALHCAVYVCVRCDPLVQVTKMYEDAVRERESVVTRLARMDNERRQLIDSKEDVEKKARDLTKVRTCTGKSNPLKSC